MPGDVVVIGLVLVFIALELWYFRAAAAGGVATWIVVAKSLRLAKFNPTSAT